MTAQPTDKELLGMMWDRFPSMLDKQKREWVGLTEDEIEIACRFIEPSLAGPIAYDLQIARAIEAKLKKKNHAKTKTACTVEC
jgi:hypothetical protein